MSKLSIKISNLRELRESILYYLSITIIYYFFITSKLRKKIIDTYNSNKGNNMHERVLSVGKHPYISATHFVN